MTLRSPTLMVCATVLSAFMAAHAGAATWHVDDDAPGDPGPQNPLISNLAENGSLATPYDRIQEAINVAASGDTILVAPGIYHEFGTVNLLSKNLTIAGSPATPADTIIDMVNWGEHVMQITGGQNATTVIEGFTLKNGWSVSAFPNDRGAGLYCDNSSPIIRNCIITANQATNGGGFYTNLGVPQFFDCQFIGNSAVNGGAAYLNATTTNFTDCTFVNNSVGNVGGAIRQATVAGVYTRCEFTGNSAVNGGAMDMAGGATAGMTYRDCVFTSNNASGVGGAVQLATPTNTIINWINCVFFDNAATGNGGAVHVLGRGDFTNCSLSGNTTGGGGGGGAIYTMGGAVTNARNCIAWGNTPNGFNGSTTATYCNVQNAMAGTGNISLNPMFVDAANGDLHIMEGSPCIDRGNSTLVPLTLAGDYDGLPRVVNGLESGALGVAAFGYFVDMGAFEFQPQPIDPPDTCPADMAPDGGDGLVNIDDLLRVVNGWGLCP